MPASVPEVDVAHLAAVPSGDVVVVDVREDDEWEAGHIDGAVHIAMMDVPGRLDEFPGDRQVLVVCRVGGRSAQVTGYLRSEGRDAVNLAGGMMAWAAAGRPMVSEGAAAPQVV